MASCLELWGKVVTMKFFASKSSLSITQKKAVLEIVEWMSQPDCDSIFECESHEDCIKIICCLPYILGFSLHEGKIPRAIMDLQKPILILALSVDFLSNLKRNLSSNPVDGGMPYLQCLGIVTTLQLNQGVYYSNLVIKNGTDVRKITKSMGKVDIVLSHIDQCSKLSSECFSVVFVIGYPSLPAKEFQDINDKFSSRTKVILFTSDLALSSVQASTSQPSLSQSERSSSSKSWRPQHRANESVAVPLLVKYAYIVGSNLIQSFLSKLQLDMMNEIVMQLSETSPSNVSVVVSMNSEASSMELLCYLPYFLGQSWMFLHVIDLRAPILVLTSSPHCWDLLRKNLCHNPYIVSSGHLSQRSVAEGALYSTYLVEDVFSAATVFRVACDHQIVLAPSTYYQSLPKDCFSVVVVFGSNYLTPAAETNIMKSFQESKTIFFKTDSGKSNVGVVTRTDARVTALYQALSDCYPVPRLKLHGPHVKEMYFAEETTLLSRAQLMALNNLVNWFMFNAGESAVVDSQLEFQEIAEVICSLPCMFGWAVSMGMILDSAVDLKHPFLVLGQKETVDFLWQMLYFKPFFIPSDHLFPFETYFDTLYSSCLVKDAEGARDIRKIVGVDDVALSDFSYLDDLPADCFSVVVVAYKGSLPEMLMNQILTKFGEHSKLIFINVHSYREEAEELYSDSQLGLPSALLKFGEEVKEWLFVKCFSLSLHEIAVLKNCVDWMAQSETKNLPQIIEAGPNFTNVSQVLGVLPYMLGWAVQTCLIPSSGVDLLSKSILVLASEKTVMNYLKNIFFNPFLVKSGLLTPEFVQRGAYYRVKALEEWDIHNAASLSSDFDILLCDFCHYLKFSRDFASAVFVVSPTGLKPREQKEVSVWFVPYTKLAFVTLVPAIDHFYIQMNAKSVPDSGNVPKVSSHSLIVGLCSSLAAPNESPAEEVQNNLQERKKRSQHFSKKATSELNSSARQSSKEISLNLSETGILDNEVLFEKYVRDCFRKVPTSLPHLTSSVQTELSEIPTTDSACQTFEVKRRKNKRAHSSLKGYGDLNLTQSTIERLPKEVSKVTQESENDIISSYGRALSKEMTLSDLLDEMMSMPSDQTHSHKKKRKPLLRRRRMTEIFVPETIRKMVNLVKNRHKSRHKQEEKKTSDRSFSAEDVSHEISVKDSGEKASVEDISLQVLGKKNEEGETVFEDSFTVGEKEGVCGTTIPVSISVHDLVEDTDRNLLGKVSKQGSSVPIPGNKVEDKIEVVSTGGSQPEKSDQSSDLPSIHKC